MCQSQGLLFDSLEQSGMSGKQIALAAGVSDSAISLMKSGKRTLSVAALRQLCHRLGSSTVADLFSWLCGGRTDIKFIPNGTRAAHPMRQCAEAQRAIAELTDEVAVALQDGYVSEAERLGIDHTAHKAQLVISRV